MKLKFKEGKGITLIALVITIVVLLILAGVSIATLTGENGIITQAMKAKEATEIGEEKEQIELAYISSEGKINLGKITPESLQEEIENRGYKNTVTKERDENGKEGLLVILTKKDRYYFIENKKVREATKEEFSKEITPVYAIFYSDGDLRFNQTGNIDETKTSNGVSVVIKSNDISELNTTSASRIPWNSKLSEIKSITFEEKVAPKYTAYWFYNCSNIETINNIGRLKTNNVINMKHMFENLAKITTLDLSTFDTSNVTEMASMFQGMTSHKELDISSFDTSKSNRMDYMFYNCSSLIKLDLTKFDTSNVRKMEYMFYNCSSLDKLDLSNFNTLLVDNMNSMFGNCSNLVKLELNNFNTLNVTNMMNMFIYCSNLLKLDLTTFNTSNVKNMESMFAHCYKLEEIKFGDNFSIENVIAIQWMFDKCSSITNLDLSSLKNTKATNMNRVFADMYNLQSLDISNLDTSNITHISSMFEQCERLENLDIRTASFKNVTECNGMFLGINTEITIIVKDDEVKTWVQDKLGTGNGKVYKVSELPSVN